MGIGDNARGDAAEAAPASELIFSLVADRYEFGVVGCPPVASGRW